MNLKQKIEYQTHGLLGGRLAVLLERKLRLENQLSMLNQEISLVQKNSGANLQAQLMRFQQQVE